MKKFNNYFAKTNILKTIICSACILSILLLFTPLKLLALLLFLALFSIIIALPKAIDSILFRIVFSFLAITSYWQLLGVLLWLLHVNLSWNVAMLPAIILLLLFYLLKKPEINKINLFTKKDLFSLFISLFSISIIAITTLTGGPIGQQLIRYTTTGFDNTAHLSLTISLFDSNKYLHGKPDKVDKEIVYKSLSAYPQGWHLSNSLLWHGITDKLPTNEISKVLMLYFATVMFWYGLMIFIICRLMLDATIKIKKKFRDSIPFFTTLIFIVMLQELLLISLLKFGFTNFIGLICYLFALVYLMLNINKDDNPSAVFIMGALFCSAISLTWLLAAPIGYLMLGFICLKYCSSSLKCLLGYAKKHLLAVLLFSIIILLGFYQFLVQVFINPIPGSINADGGIWELSPTLFALLFIVVVIGFIKDKLNQNNDALVYLLFSFGSITGFVYFYQFFTSGRISYYSNKISSLLFILLFILIVAVVSKFLRNLKSVFLSILLLLSIAFIVPLVTSSDIKDVRFLSGSYRKLSPYTSSQLYPLIINGTGLNGNVIINKNLDYEEDVISTHFMQMLSRKDPQCHQEILWLLLSKQEGLLPAKILECSKIDNTKFYLVVSKNNYAQLSDYYKSNTSNVEVLLSN